MSEGPNNPYVSPNLPPLPPESAEMVPVLSSDVTNIAMLCHLLALTAYVTGVGHIIGPLILWLIKKDDHPFIDEAGKESINFQISMTIYMLIAVPTLCIGIGFVVLPALGILDTVLTIVAAVKTANGEHYRYPLTIRFLR